MRGKARGSDGILADRQNGAEGLGQRLKQLADSLYAENWLDSGGDTFAASAGSPFTAAPTAVEISAPVHLPPQNSNYFSLAGGNFSQDWSNAAMITANDDWSGVPSIVGYLGDTSASQPIAVDPQTLTANDSSAVDVIANAPDPNTLTAGGVAEFGTIANPTIALQGSGTADSPYIVIFLDSTGRQDIVFSANIRDIDGSADDAIQPVVVQYRTSPTGTWINVPGGFIADATSGPSLATQVTGLNLTLPAGANNQSQLQIRIMTTNAAGSDEWVGIDDIVVSSAPLSPGTLSVNDITLDEGNSGTTSFTFTVTRSGGSSGAVSAEWSLDFGSADAGDFDPFPQSGTVSFADGVTTATITVTVQGDLTFEPNETFIVQLGNPTGGVTIGDGVGLATITNDDAPPNDPPVGVDDSYSVDEDGTLTVDAANGVLANDTDSDNDELSVGIVTAASNGMVVLNDDGSFTYTPDANFSGTDSFAYGLADGIDSAGPFTVTITVNPINDVATIAGENSGSVTEDDSLVASGVLSVSDVDDGENELQPLSGLGANGYGSFEVNVDGSWTYTLNNAHPMVQGLDTGETLTDTIVVTSEDGTATETITVTINGADEVNNPAVGNADSYTLDEDQPLVVTAATGVLANDSDPDSDPLSASLVANVSNGTLVFNSDGSFTYTPNADFNGTDSFTYEISDGTDFSGPFTVTLTVDSVNDPAIITGDSTGSVTEDGTLFVAGTLSASDIDSSGSFQVQSGTTTSYGSFSIDLAGNWNYQLNNANPAVQALNTGQTLTDTVQVLSADGTSHNVVITINGVNEPNVPPIANDDTLAAVEDTPITYSASALLGNDNDGGDGGPLVIIAVSNATGGTAVLNMDGTVTFTPTANFNGVAGFDYMVSDGTDTDVGHATINVAPANDAPDGVDGSINFYEDSVLILNDPSFFGYSDPEGDAFGGVWIDSTTGNGAFTLNGVALTTPVFVTAVQIAAGELRFTPAPNATGNSYAEFAFRVSDVGGATDASANIRVINLLAVNDPPTGNADGYSVNEDGILVVNAAAGVLSNDTDIDGGALTVASLASGPANGSLILNSDGSFTYTPNANFNGVDSFSYNVSDGTSTSGPVTVSLTVNAVNDAPVNTVGGPVSVNEDTSIALTGVSIADDDGAGATYTVLLTVQRGSLSIRTDVAGGITAANIISGNSGTNGITITGTLAQINATLAAGNGLTYQGDLNFNGNDSLRISTWEGVRTDAATIGTPTVLATSAQPIHIVSGDINGDGRADLVYTLGTSGQVAYRLGNGNGTFGSETSLSGAAGATSVAIGDVDGDGIVDLAVVSYAGAVGANGRIGVYYGTGGGAFGALQNFATLPQAYDITLADMNNDGRLDIIGDRRDVGSSYVYLQTATPRSFAAPAIYTMSISQYTKSIITADFNNDGLMDLVAVNPGSSATGNPPGSVIIRFGTGGGALGGIFGVGNSQFTNIRYWEAAAADLNNDGNLDLVVSSIVDFGGFTVFMGDGTGNFANGVQYATGGNTTGIQLRDINGDGIVDALFTTQGNPGATGWRLGNGNGTFQAAVTVAGGFNPESLAIADFDGDGDLDFASVGQSDDTLRIFLNNGTALGDIDTRTITVNPVNDAPSGTNATLSITEDGSRTLAAADFGFSDPVEGNGFAGVVITTLPGAGTLRLGGNTFTAGTFVTAAELAGGLLVYTPGADGNGSGYASFTFQVRDNGGTANTGQDTDQSANTLTFNVSAVNDTPTVSLALSGGATEQIAYSLKGGITIGDVDAAGGTITVTLAVDYGVINVGLGGSGASIVSGNGSASVVVSGTLAQIIALLGSDATSTVEFIANTDTPPSSAALTVTVNDNGNTGTGGNQLASANTMIAITAVNDLPVADLNGAAGGIDTTAAYTEGDGRVNLIPGIVLSDVDNATLTGATVTIASGFVLGDTLRINTAVAGISYSYNAATGVLTLSGSASVAAYQSVLTGLSFKSSSDNVGTTRDITVTVTDGSATSVAAHIIMTVSPVNDAPVNTTPGAQSGIEGGTIVFSTANGNALSVFDPDAGTLRIKIRVDHGTLTLATTDGLIVTGNGTGRVVIIGTQAAINAALDGLSYHGTTGYIGTDTLTFESGDQGNSGSGGPLIDFDAVAITLQAASAQPLLSEIFGEEPDSNIAWAFMTGDDRGVTQFSHHLAAPRHELSPNPEVWI